MWYSKTITLRHFENDLAQEYQRIHHIIGGKRGQYVKVIIVTYSHHAHRYRRHAHHVGVVDPRVVPRVHLKVQPDHHFQHNCDHDHHRDLLWLDYRRDPDVAFGVDPVGVYLWDPESPHCRRRRFRRRRPSRRCLLRLSFWTFSFYQFLPKQISGHHPLKKV